jgi:GMP synthase (glutamine-hydrolysing)
MDDFRALALVHQRDAGPGVFAEEFAARGHRLDSWLISDGAQAPGDPRDYDAVLTFGGAMNTHEEQDHPWLRFEKDLLGGLFDRGMPLLGVCLGSQLLGAAVSADVRRSREPEIGWHEVEVTEEGAEDPLFAPLAPSFTAFSWHSYEAGLPHGAVALARSPVCVHGWRLESAWAIQFHAEVSAADLDHWIDDYESDPDAVRTVNPEALARQTHERIEEWNRLGRELCGRFLDAVGA